MKKQSHESTSEEVGPLTDQAAVRPTVKVHWRSLLLAFGFSFAVAGIGGSLTVLDAWYFALNQPGWKPPDPAFGAIWSVIFSLCAVCAWLGWHACESLGQRRTWLVLWALNAFFNIFWSLIYFKWHRPDWSLMELPFIWLTILALMGFIYPRRRLAAGLLLPYLLWVSTAGLLNHATVELNGPFGPEKALLERQPGE
jgi:tryptophan-rich sensory protein